MSDNPEMETAEKFYSKPEEAEPIKPTVEPVVTTVAPAEQEVEKVAEPEKSEELEAKGEEKESQFIELDGEEIDLNDIKVWRDGHMMQSDYTKKTTALSDERKSFDAERTSDREKLTQEQAKVTEMSDKLQALVTEDDAIDWAELKEDDPERYIELKEQADKRKDLMEQIKADRESELLTDDPATIQDEQRKLLEANPEWINDGKMTKVYDEDIKLIEGYAMNNGFAQEFSTMTQERYMTALLKAAKYDQLQEKGRKIKETREKVPVVSKPKGKIQTAESIPMEDKFYRPVNSA